MAHTYSPKIPRNKKVTPKKKNIEVIIRDIPGAAWIGKKVTIIREYIAYIIESVAIKKPENIQILIGKFEKDINPLIPSFIKASEVDVVFPFLRGSHLYSTVVELNPQLAIIPLR
jgi:hypothetical protein